MKTYEQLMKHYWGVIVPMAEAAGINPWDCVRYPHDCGFVGHPKFNLDIDKYTFALTVLEGRPVWEGDEIYSKETGMKIKVMAHHAERYLRWESMTWTPPTKKRTFMLGGKELNSPVNKGKGDYLTRVAGNEFYFTNYDDRNALDNILYELLTTARDKE